MSKSTGEKARHADSLPVHCSFGELADPAALVPNPRNPNVHPEAQIRMLARLIRAHGWRCPITVSRRSGFVVRGHGRLAAALTLGVRECPVDFQDYATEAEEWADLMADNQISTYAELDLSLARELALEIESGGLELDLAGFDGPDLDRLLAENIGANPGATDPPPEDTYREQYAVMVVCRDQDHQQEVYETLLQQGHELKVVVT